jgi:hypothetical protein
VLHILSTTTKTGHQRYTADRAVHHLKVRYIHMQRCVIPKHPSLQAVTKVSPVNLTTLAFFSTLFSTSFTSIPLDCNTSSRGLAAPKMDDLDAVVDVDAAA